MRLVIALAVAAGSASGGCSMACPTGLAEGVLTEQPGELVLVSDPGRATRVIWPNGYAVRRAPDSDDLLVVNLFGDVVAREGDSVRLGGGQGHQFGQPDAWAVCGSIEVVG